MKRTSFAILIGLFCLFPALFSQVRSEFLLEKNWKFTREDSPEFINPTFNDSKWQSVTVPHDWAIYGPFSSQNDKQEVAIAQDGQTEAMEHAGRTGGLPFVGVGWYRTEFEVPQFTDGKRATILFDGAMSHAKVYVNGQEVGYWPYGYNSFYFDITKQLMPGKKNTLAVRLENLPESSRWYPGAGLYRNVHVIVTENAHIPVWGTYVTTPTATKEFAKVNVRTQIVLLEGADAGKYSVKTSVWNPNGQKLTEQTIPLSQIKYNDNSLSQEFIIQTPTLWSPDMPALYSAETRLYEGDQLKDIYTTPFGIRSIEIIPNKGFFLNGEKTVFKGVCNHHDLGPLGAAVNDAAIRRQIRILKDMGCNAIRTSHNMPAPELVTACDEMGMMLMVESFDEWNKAKCANGYNLIFDEWVEKDLVNLVHHYRNNPSVVMWCVGNEVPNQWDESGCKISKFLQDRKEEVIKALGLKNGDFVGLAAGKKLEAQKTAGVYRKLLGAASEKHMKKDCYEFCWIVDFPMYEIGEESGELEFCHNPFSMPQGGMDALNNQDPLEILAYQYDLVCNGVELSSGAVRNHDPEIMIKAFELVGLGEADVKAKFPAMYNAFCYGAPPHAGIAPGVDRMIMLICGEESIREIIPFPMNKNAMDIMMGAPGTVEQKQLDELHLAITAKPEE